jgi:hypothetical protein
MAFLTFSRWAGNGSPRSGVEIKHDVQDFIKIYENNATFGHFLAYYFIISLICTKVRLIFRENLKKLKRFQNAGK